MLQVAAAAVLELRLAVQPELLELLLQLVVVEGGGGGGVLVGGRGGVQRRHGRHRGHGRGAARVVGVCVDRVGVVTSRSWGAAGAVQLVQLLQLGRLLLHRVEAGGGVPQQSLQQLGRRLDVLAADTGVRCHYGYKLLLPHLAELYSGLPCSDLVGEGQVVGLEGAVSFW